MDEQTKTMHREWIEKTPDLTIRSDVLAQYLIEAGVIDSRCSRVIIDLQVGEPVRLYIERFGGARLLKPDWIEALRQNKHATDYLEAPE